MVEEGINVDLTRSEFVVEFNKELFDNCFEDLNEFYRLLDDYNSIYKRIESFWGMEEIYFLWILKEKETGGQNVLIDLDKNEDGKEEIPKLFYLPFADEDDQSNFIVINNDKTFSYLDKNEIYDYVYMLF